mmetsp:Transcript_4931/g.9172  ORF Transcript_4931/g.9172 Transcript_4931/m.9172 type:complete len:83 (+) Transcript_4931:242-490(+)
MCRDVFDASDCFLATSIVMLSGGVIMLLLCAATLFFCGGSILSLLFRAEWMRQSALSFMTCMLVVYFYVLCEWKSYNDIISR